jgi:anaerobic selenocysteine-containing dehydrogenase
MQENNRSSNKNIQQTLGNQVSRRDFLKLMTAVGAIAALPGSGLLKKGPAASTLSSGAYEGKDAYQVFHNSCPRNCYDTCSIVSYVKDGVLKFVEGDPKSTFTRGGLCVKGYSYPRSVYSPDRIKYPMKQEGRGTGNWKRISWDEALETISKKILEIKEKDGTLLGLGMTKYSGNFGITHYGVEGTMSSLGYTTRFVGTPCWPAGIDAQNFDLGNMWCNDPEDMVHSKYIIVWGANPCTNSIHSMKYINEAKRRGAKVVVIDPVFTQTAAKADEYWQIKPGGDGALALGMARHLIDKKLVDQAWLDEYSEGYSEFASYLRREITVDWAAEQSGIPAERIMQITEEFAGVHPATIWIGYGLQRHVNGGANVRAIDAIVAMTGNVGKVGGGARYGHLYTWGFNYNAMVQSAPEGSKGYTGKTGPMGEFDTGQGGETTYTDRAFNINKIAQEILDATEPPVRMLWIANKNVLSQDFDRNKIIEAFKKLELIVAVDLFFNPTVEQADIVLPTTTLFEDWTVNVSYWHYWMSINEQAIAPLYETKSDIEIASALSAKLNSLQPGSCTFPENIDAKEMMVKEFNDGIYSLFGIQSWEDLKEGAHKAQLASSASWSDFKFGTPSGKYEFKSSVAEEYGHTALVKYKEPRKAYDTYRLLTPHSKYNLHSQFQNLDWMLDYNPEPLAYIHPHLAKKKGISNGDMVRVFNKTGEVKLTVNLTDNVPADTILMYEGWYGQNNPFNVNILVDDESSDMGKYKTGSPGVAIHDQFAEIEKA